MTWVDTRFAQWKPGRSLANVRRRVADDLEAYDHEPIEAIATRYWSARDREAAAPQPSTQDVMAVYETTDRYVYESSYFETLAEYQRYFETIRRACVQWGLGPVLDFGGGAGGLTFALASAGISCDYADVPGPTSDYARWRFQRYALRAQVLDATQPLPSGRYHAIVTLDVFEHLPDLRQVVGQLVEALMPGGWLISKSTFAADDPLHLPQNLVYADIRLFNQFLAGMGLVYGGRLRPDPLSESWFKWCGWPGVWRVWRDRQPKFGGRFVMHQAVTARRPPRSGGSARI